MHIVRSSGVGVICFVALALAALQSQRIVAQDAAPATSPVLKVLFLGDNGHHQPAERFRLVQPILGRRFQLAYENDPNVLAPEKLAPYDVLVIYANIERIEPAQEDALLDFVAGGKGLVALHCASFCFLNSDRYVDLVGAQFERHETGVFRAENVAPDHPIMQGYGGFESWDETYVHRRHNERDRTVLEVRVDGDLREPWTWVRTHGKGRVFYSAWGHDQRTWRHPGFVNLVERGILWAAGRDPQGAGAYLADRPFNLPSTTPREDLPLFEYVDVGKKIPNYPPSNQWGVQEEPFHLMQKPLAADESIKHLVVPPGFHVELFAAEPDLGGKPITMAWDERGRLWVAETYDYPNELQPPGKGRDRIRICEDTDGDGRADKFTVFAEELSIPTAIAFSHGGAIVQNAQETLYLKDTDGDDRADERRVLFSGWATGDTHGGVSNFQYGLDNWVWAMQGYNDSSPRNAEGKSFGRFRQGFFRFKADGSELEFLRSTNNNTWGLGISEEGLIFGSTANRCPSVYMPIPNRYYEAVRGWAPSLVLDMMSDTHLFKAITPKVRQVDHHNGYTAGAGHSLYTARAYPQEYWNRTAFVAEGTGHLVGTFVLRREGTDFRSTNLFNLLASDDEWTAPIMAEVGPDGSVWVIDWYNFIVQHNPTPQGFQTGRGNAYESDLRDKKHGRIYRVVYDQSSAPARKTLAGATPRELAAALADTNFFWRRHAQRLLVERGQLDVLPELIALVQNQSVDEIGLNAGAIHALWTMHGLGALDGKHDNANAAVYAALRHPSAGVRMNAVRVLPRNENSLGAMLLAQVHTDDDPHVRLSVLLALSEIPNAPAIGNVVVVLMDKDVNMSDRWLPDAIVCAASANSDAFLTTITQLPTLTSERLEVVRVVAEHYARGAPGGNFRSLLSRVSDADPAIAEAIVRGLVVGWPDKSEFVIDAALEDDLEQLAAKLTPGTQGRLVKLAERWGSTRLAGLAEQLSASLLAAAANEQFDESQRISAAREYIEFRSDNIEAVDRVLELVTPQASPTLSAGLLRALESSAAADTAGRLIERLTLLLPEPRTSAAAVLLSRPEWTQTLLAAAEENSSLLAELSLDQKQALLAHPSRRIRRQADELLKRGGALPDVDRQKVLAELLPIAQVKGDAAAGKLVFTKHCATCHMHSGEGKRIGPDLTGMAVHPKSELLANVIDPSSSVEGNYRVYTVVTEAGQVLTGLLAAESRTALELIDSEGKSQTLLREDVSELAASRKSLMPEGFEKQVSREELTNLLEFLTQRGRYLPLDLRKVATVSSVKGMFQSPESTEERLVFDDWGPKTVEGVPFVLVDPLGGRAANVVMLHGPLGRVAPTMPRQVELTCNSAAKRIHLLSGVSGWGYPAHRDATVSLIVRLHYHDGTTEDHELKNGEHFADYIRRVDVPGSEFAFELKGRQMRYLSIEPAREEVIDRVELVKGDDATAPVVMAVTVEGR